MHSACITTALPNLLVSLPLPRTLPPPSAYVPSIVCLWILSPIPVGGQRPQCIALRRAYNTVKTTLDTQPMPLSPSAQTVWDFPYRVPRCSHSRYSIVQCSVPTDSSDLIRLNIMVSQRRNSPFQNQPSINHRSKHEEKRIQRKSKNILPL